MSIESINFGDIFYKDGNEYVFLVATDEDVIYAARVLNKDESKTIENYCNRSAGSSAPVKNRDRFLFYWVKLTSKNLENRLAHFKSADNAMSIFPYTTTGHKLNDEDKKSVIKEILDPKVNLPGELKNLIGELTK